MDALRIFVSSAVLFACALPTSYAVEDSAPGDGPTGNEVSAALHRATQFLSARIADHGGYKWVSSADGKLGNGEGIAPPGTIWVQPPGTPAVGLALLQAYEATQEPIHLQAAEAAALALVRGQLRSGGWHYRIEFDPSKRTEFVYRSGPQGSRESIPQTPLPGGWEIWRQRKYQADMTIIDDDTTPAALRLLIRVDQALGFRNREVHEAAKYALESTGNAQYPNGAWSHNYDRFPLQPPSEDFYPVLIARYPTQWSRTWSKDFTGCYVLNDRITQNMIVTMLLAYRVYGDKQYLASATRGGDFLLAAQMPDPQPAWAQQYDRQMQPVWDRKFEPPAISGLESQDVLETLLTLYRETGDRRYLQPIPRALAYLKKCQLPDGTLARFYELESNRPLYFTKDYQLTYQKDDVPRHYGFGFPSRLQAIEAQYRQLADAPPERLQQEKAPEFTPELVKTVREVLASQRKDGAWLEPGEVRDANGRKVRPPEGVVHSQTFIDHVGTLTRYLAALPKDAP